MSLVVVYISSKDKRVISNWLDCEGEHGAVNMFLLSYIWFLLPKKDRVVVWFISQALLALFSVSFHGLHEHVRTIETCCGWGGNDAYPSIGMFCSELAVDS